MWVNAWPGDSFTASSKSAIARFSRTLGTLVTSGVPILQALNITRDTAGNVVVSDAIEKGVGRLVDADMNEESTRLKALQTQQQLAVQSLSIANSSSEVILSLFR